MCVHYQWTDANLCFVCPARAYLWGRSHSVTDYRTAWIMGPVGRLVCMDGFIARHVAAISKDGGPYLRLVRCHARSLALIQRTGELHHNNTSQIQLFYRRHLYTNPTFGTARGLSAFKKKQNKHPRNGLACRGIQIGHLLIPFRNFPNAGGGVKAKAAQGCCLDSQRPCWFMAGSKQGL